MSSTSVQQVCYHQQYLYDRMLMRQVVLPWSGVDTVHMSHIIDDTCSVLLGRVAAEHVPRTLLTQLR